MKVGIFKNFLVGVSEKSWKSLTEKTFRILESFFSFFFFIHKFKLLFYRLDISSCYKIRRNNKIQQKTKYSPTKSLRHTETGAYTRFYKGGRARFKSLYLHRVYHRAQPRERHELYFFSISDICTLQLSHHGSSADTHTWS